MFLLPLLILNSKETLKTCVECINLKFFQHNGNFHSKSFLNSIFYLINLIAITSLISTFLFLKSFGGSFILADPREAIDALVDYFPKDLEVEWTFNAHTGTQLNTNHPDPYSIYMPITAFWPLFGLLDDELQSEYHVVHMVVGSGSTTAQLHQALAGKVAEDQTGLRNLENGPIPPVLLFANDALFIHNLLIGALDDVRPDPDPPTENYYRLPYQQEAVLLRPVLQVFCERRRLNMNEIYECSKQVLEKRAPVLKASPIFELTDYKVHLFVIFQVFWAVQFLMRIIFVLIYLFLFHWLMLMLMVFTQVSNEILSNKKAALLAIYSITPSLVASSAMRNFLPSGRLLLLLFAVHISTATLACKAVVAAPFFRMVNTRLQRQGNAVPPAQAAQPRPNPPRPTPDPVLRQPRIPGGQQAAVTEQSSGSTEDVIQLRLVVDHISPTTLALTWHFLDASATRLQFPQLVHNGYSIRVLIQVANCGSYTDIGSINSSSSDEATLDGSTVTIFSLKPQTVYQFRVEAFSGTHSTNMQFMGATESQVVKTPAIHP